MPTENLLEASGLTTLSGTRMIRFRYPGCADAYIAVEEALRGAAAVQSRLVAQGYPLLGKGAVEIINVALSGIVRYETSDTIDQSGWHTDAHFVLPNGEVISRQGAAAPLLLHDSGRMPTRVENGDGDWKHDVADQLAGQHLLMFLVMFALSAPLLGLFGRKTVVIEIVGRSGVAKSLATALIASTQGQPVAYPVAFDDLAADPDGFIAARAGGVAAVGDPRFYLAGETPRRTTTLLTRIARASIDAVRPIGLLITARESLIDAVGAETNVGGIVQDALISLRIPDDWVAGIFSFVPDEHATTKAFQDVIVAAMAKAHESPLRLYVERLISELDGGREEFSGKVLQHLAKVRRRLNIDDDMGAAVRQADVFGLIEVAGKSAKAWGILPKSWKCGAAIDQCFRQFRWGPPAPRPYLDQLEEIARGPGVLLLDSDPAPTQADIAQANVFLRERAGARSLLIRQEVRRAYLPAWRHQTPPLGLREYLKKDGDHWSVWCRLGKTRVRVHSFTMPPISEIED